MTIYCGVVFHAPTQSLSYCVTHNREISSTLLDHCEKVDLPAFYSQLKGDVIIGLAASGYSPWFEHLIERLGHTLCLGQAAEIRRLARRRQKNDRRDADLILDLLVRGDFPRLHRPSPTGQEVLAQLRYRRRLVKIRTIVNNNPQAIAIGAGLGVKAELFTRSRKEMLNSLQLTATTDLQRRHWLELLKEVDERILKVDAWLKQKARDDTRASLLQTHPRIGVLTSLGLAHTLEPITRFSNSRKVVAYPGLEPMERSSAEKKRYLGISKAGSTLMSHLMVESAPVAVRADSELKGFYLRLMKSKDKQKAIVAVAGKLLVCSYIMLRDGIDYTELVRGGVEARPARFRT